MNNETWQQLLSLESRDITSKWFEQIHSRELNARRAKEINSTAKQAREYFRNAYNSYHSVRPLLTFYGVACLSRALLLLLKQNGGEECLSGSHGLETIDWKSIMSGEVADRLEGLGCLKIRTSDGLFSDFITQTENKILIHINSSGVDWRLCYDIPKKGVEITLDDLFSRIPDLQQDYISISNEPKYTLIQELRYTEEKGFIAKVQQKGSHTLSSFYKSAGYSVSGGSNLTILKADAETFSKNIPLFIHTYIHKTFGKIPTLYLSEPFHGNARFSQLGITYLISYTLGMLVRYYPTHWISLIQGNKGDVWWPSVNRAQRIVEESFPELVIEFIRDILRQSDANKTEGSVIKS